MPIQNLKISLKLIPRESADMWTFYKLGSGKIAKIDAISYESAGFLLEIIKQSNNFKFNLQYDCNITAVFGDF